MNVLSSDIVSQELDLQGEKITLLYQETLCDTKRISQDILFPFTTLSKEKLKNFSKYLPLPNPISIRKNEISFYLNHGYVLLKRKNKIIAYECKKTLDRGIGSVESELSLCGPKDSFTENFSTNLGLIRKRIKKDLVMEEMFLGRYTQTKVGILSIHGIVKHHLVEHIKEKLKKINIDGILDSSYLKDDLQNQFHLFPTIMMSERPDKCCMALLEGKVIILVDNSPYALILPSLFFDYFHTTDDYYQKAFYTSFIRLIRFIAFLIAIFTPAIYISVTTRNYSMVPLPLLLMLKAGRSFVPFPAYIEALFMIICFEILKESDLRMSMTSGSSISILGGLILGDAAVSAGIVSPIMIIVIAISSIAGLIFPSVELGNALRSYKIFLFVLATLLGIYGVILGSIIMFCHVFSTKIFGYSYFSFDKNEIKDSILRIPSKIQTRNSQLSNNRIRGRKS